MLNATTSKDLIVEVIISNGSAKGNSYREVKCCQYN